MDMTDFVGSDGLVLPLPVVKDAWWGWQNAW
jgi:hypothetical protein